MQRNNSKTNISESTPRSFDRVRELQSNQKLFIKNLTVGAHGSSGFKGWDYFFNEFDDKKIVRKAVLGRYQGQFYIKYDFSKEKYVLKQVPKFDAKGYEYTTPTSVSLLPKSGLMTTYGENIQKNTRPEMNVGILFDVDKCQVKEHHIYKSDGQTGKHGVRSWYEKKFYDSENDANEMLSALNKELKDPDAKKRLINDKVKTTMEQLRKETSSSKKKYAYNELLVRMKEASIEGIYATMYSKNDFKKHLHPSINALNYASKLFILQQQHILQKKFGIDTPLLLRNKKGLSEYTLKQQEEDYEILIDDKNKDLRAAVFKIINPNAKQMSDESMKSNLNNLFRDTNGQDNKKEAPSTPRSFS